MVFERVYCSFSFFALVNVWWCKLVLRLLLGNEVFHGFGGLIVQAMELWFEALSCEHSIYFFIGFDGVIVVSAFGWFDMYGVGIKIVGDKYVFVAVIALNRKSSH